ncbi:histidine phosphatase family protein [Listeria ivanovii]|uniref:Histidine phosphatase family protein n=1 Tax=Listeria ivanovii subsp. londoniensis TaxID=202752 RepID=A0ABS1G310_LISIV|nr:histidine phosphatase family protein [Listeria ivanovii]AIS58898.1 phosphoglycerate mutase [Listeria ivanovii subsp. londoniensis]MBK1961248.1 histidine phosphatase family protein [Listeria ivanovii subsp. londoniensis]MBK2002016.1 histidine phosphatase family protein [Listeria ivanovii subsp. londoniensis]MBM5720857.1 histidine phosphatase family protein [Listeria ivanovii]
MKKNVLKVMVMFCALLLIAGCGNDSTSSKTKTTEKKDGTVTFYVVRHGKTMLNTTDRVQGWSDAVLTPAGEEVVTSAGKGLKDVDFGAAYSSDSGRAIQTANLILEESAKSSDTKLQTDARFREFNFGSYEGDLNHNMWSDIAKSQGKTLEEWQSAGISPKEFADSVAKLDKTRVKAGENWPAEDYATIQARLKDGITEVAKKESKKGDENVLLVSHGLSIGALLDTIEPGYKLPATGIQNASVTKITYKDGNFKIEDVNDMSYVEKGQE